MRIVPVIDILNGTAVHAVRGKRAEYQPLESCLCDSSNPLVVARAFESYGFEEIYVADLDAILGKGSNRQVIEQIAKQTVLSLMVDAGVSDLNSSLRLLDIDVGKVILGTETLLNLKVVKEIIDCLGSSKIVVSLDLKAGKLLSKSEAASAMTPIQLASALEAMGICELIVLDLTRVGSGEGVDIDLLKQMRKKLKVRLLVGGGVRSIEDLVALKRVGVDGVLLATALHSGKITVEALRASELLT